MTHKSSEPACRVCGCTEFNACDGGCSWVKVEVGSLPLCSACSGTPTDMIEVCQRIRRNFRRLGFAVDTAREANVIFGALGVRAKARINAEALSADPSWGGR